MIFVILNRDVSFRHFSGFRRRIGLLGAYFVCHRHIGTMKYKFRMHFRCFEL